MRFITKRHTQRGTPVATGYDDSADVIGFRVDPKGHKLGSRGSGNTALAINVSREALLAVGLDIPLTNATDMEFVSDDDGLLIVRNPFANAVKAAAE